MASLKRAALGRRALLTFPQPLCELGVPAMLRAVRPDWVTAVGLALAANSSSATVEWPYPAAPMQRRVPVVVHCIHNGLCIQQPSGHGGMPTSPRSAGQRHLPIRSSRHIAVGSGPTNRIVVELCVAAPENFQHLLAVLRPASLHQVFPRSNGPRRLASSKLAWSHGYREDGPVVSPEVRIFPTVEVGEG
eukprot:RCo020233